VKFLEGCNITGEADHGEPADDSPRGVFDRLKRLESEQSDCLDNFPLPPADTEPEHAR
jgi:hypothetical protein